MKTQDDNELYRNFELNTLRGILKRSDIDVCDVQGISCPKRGLVSRCAHCKFNYATHHTGTDITSRCVLIEFKIFCMREEDSGSFII